MKGYKRPILSSSVKTLGFPLHCGPLVILALKFALDPGDSDGGPDAGPEEGEDPTNLQELVRYLGFDKYE